MLTPQQKYQLLLSISATLEIIINEHDLEQQRKPLESLKSSVTKIDPSSPSNQALDRETFNDKYSAEHKKITDFTKHIFDKSTAENFLAFFAIDENDQELLSNIEGFLLIAKQKAYAHIHNLFNKRQQSSSLEKISASTIALLAIGLLDKPDLKALKFRTLYFYSFKDLAIFLHQHYINNYDHAPYVDELATALTEKFFTLTRTNRIKFIKAFAAIEPEEIYARGNSLLPKILEKLVAGKDTSHNIELSAIYNKKIKKYLNENFEKNKFDSDKGHHILFNTKNNQKLNKNLNKFIRSIILILDTFKPVLFAIHQDLINRKNINPEKTLKQIFNLCFIYPLLKNTIKPVNKQNDLYEVLIIDLCNTFKLYLLDELSEENKKLICPELHTVFNNSEIIQLLNKLFNFDTEKQYHKRLKLVHHRKRSSSFSETSSKSPTLELPQNQIDSSKQQPHSPRALNYSSPLTKIREQRSRSAWAEELTNRSKFWAKHKVQSHFIFELRNLELILRYSAAQNLIVEHLNKPQNKAIKDSIVLRLTKTINNNMFKEDKNIEKPESNINLTADEYENLSSELTSASEKLATELAKLKNEKIAYLDKIRLVYHTIKKEFKLSIELKNYDEIMENIDTTNFSSRLVQKADKNAKEAYILLFSDISDEEISHKVKIYNKALNESDKKITLVEQELLLCNQLKELLIDKSLAKKLKLQC